VRAAVDWAKTPGVASSGHGQVSRQGYSADTGCRGDSGCKVAAPRRSDLMAEPALRIEHVEDGRPAPLRIRFIPPISVIRAAASRQVG